MKPALLVILSILLPAAAGASTVIYQHNFGGSPEDSLDGIALNTSTTTLGGTAGATWTSHEYFRADGSHTTVTNTTTNQHSAYVPFAPVSGYLYTISLTINTGGDLSNRWLALSLTSGSPDTESSSFATGAGTDYAAIARRNPSGGNQVLRRTGANGDGNFDIAGSPAGDVAILLDTTNPDQWTFRWVVDGVTSDSYDFGATENIDYIRISSDGGPFTGSIGNFAVAAVPEPGLTALSSLGACLFTFRRTRRKTPRGGL